MIDILKYNRTKRVHQIGKRIESERKRIQGKSKKKYSQQDLADAVSDMLNTKPDCKGIGQNTVSNWEKGITLPPLPKLIALSEIFECDIGYLLCDYDEPTRNLADVVEQTGLSGEAVKRLKQIHDKGQYGVTKDGYTLNMMDVLSELITSPRFFPMMNAISFYLIHGGLLPAPSDETAEDLSVDEYERFHSWAKAHGLEIEKRSDVSEMHLQIAADELKNMFREILRDELKKKKG